MVEIRALNIEDDFTDLVSLSRSFFREYESHHKEFFKIDELKDDDINIYFSSFCLNPSRAAYIAVEGAQIIGYITVYVKDQEDFWRIKKVGEISGLMVDKKYRQRGTA